MGVGDEGVPCGTSGRQGYGGSEDQIQASGSYGTRKRYVNYKGVYCAMQ